MKIVKGYYLSLYILDLRLGLGQDILGSGVLLCTSYSITRC